MYIIYGSMGAVKMFVDKWIKTIKTEQISSFLDLNLSRSYCGFIDLAE